MGRKVERRVGREGVRRGRRRGWGDVNLGLKGGGVGLGGMKEGEGVGEVGDGRKGKEGEGGDGERGEEMEWVDEESEDGDEVDRRIREAPVVVGKGDGVGAGMKDGGGVVMVGAAELRLGCL